MTHSSASLPSASYRKRLSRRWVNGLPVGGSGPTGDWLNYRAKTPAKVVWEATKSPSTTMCPRVMVNSSNAARSAAQ